LGSDTGVSLLIWGMHAIRMAFSDTVNPFNWWRMQQDPEEWGQVLLLLMILKVLRLWHEYYFIIKVFF
jgi:hypothetical protein